MIILQLNDNPLILNYNNMYEKTWFLSKISFFKWQEKRVSILLYTLFVSRTSVCALSHVNGKSQK